MDSGGHVLESQTYPRSELCFTQNPHNHAACSDKNCRCYCHQVKEKKEDYFAETTFRSAYCIGVGAQHHHCLSMTCGCECHAEQRKAARLELMKRINEKERGIEKAITV